MPTVQSEIEEISLQERSPLLPATGRYDQWDQTNGLAQDSYLKEKTPPNNAMNIQSHKQYTLESQLMNTENSAAGMLVKPSSENSLTNSDQHQNNPIRMPYASQQTTTQADPNQIIDPADQD